MARLAGMNGFWTLVHVSVLYQTNKNFSWFTLNNHDFLFVPNSKVLHQTYILLFGTRDKSCFWVMYLSCQPSAIWHLDRGRRKKGIVHCKCRYIRQDKSLTFCHKLFGIKLVFYICFLLTLVFISRTQHWTIIVT